MVNILAGLPLLTASIPGTATATSSSARGRILRLESLSNPRTRQLEQIPLGLWNHGWKGRERRKGGRKETRGGTVAPGGAGDIIITGLVRTNCASGVSWAAGAAMGFSIAGSGDGGPMEASTMPAWHAEGQFAERNLALGIRERVVFGSGDYSLSDCPMPLRQANGATGGLYLLV